MVFLPPSLTASTVQRAEARLQSMVENIINQWPVQYQRPLDRIKAGTPSGWIPTWGPVHGTTWQPKAALSHAILSVCQPVTRNVVKKTCRMEGKLDARRPFFFIHHHRSLLLLDFKSNEPKLLKHFNCFLGANVFLTSI